MEFNIDGVKVTSNIDDFTEDEARRCVDYVLENATLTEYDTLALIEVKLCDDGKIDIDYTLKGQKFERIRRITGKGIAVHSQAA